MEQKYKALIFSTYKDVYFEKKMEFTQHDSKTAKILFECYDDINVPMTDIQYAVLNIRRPDGKSYTFGMSYDGNPVFEINNNNVLLILPPAALYVAGKKYEGSIALHGTGGKRLTVTRFTYDVIEDMASDTPIDETNEFPILTALIDDVTILKDTYKGALENTAYGEIITTIDGITQRVLSTESDITTINGIVAAHNTRIESAESKITPNAIVQTVRQSEEYTNDLGEIRDSIENIELTPGPQGVPGKDGKDGSPTYTWIRYADDANGNGISNDPTGKLYIGFAYNKLTPTESTNPGDYKWSLIKGEKGDQGVAGAKGADGQTTYTWIKYSDNADGTGLYDTPKSTTKYIGIATNKTSINESDNKSDYTWSLFKGDKGDKGDQGPQGIQGPPGNDGQSQYVHIRYSANADGSGMTTNPTSTTKYVGIAVTNSPTAPSYTGFTWSKYVGEDGPQGPQGIQGPKGADGQPTYTWIKYADTPTSGMSNFPDGKKYIGMAFNKTTTTESNDYSDYQWSLMPQNIEIGGRNLIILTDALHGYPSPDGTLYSTSLARTPKEYIKVKPGEQYVLSIPYSDLVNNVVRLAQFDESKNFVGRLLYGGGTTEGDVRVHYITIPDNVYYIWPGFNRDAKVKLEKGNTATDWTPAPEDVQEQLDSQSTRISTAESSITQLSDSIALKVDSSTFNSYKSTTDSAISSLSSRVNAAELKITDSAIVSTVRSSTAYNNDLNKKADVNNIGTIIEQNADSVKVAVGESSCLKVTNDYVRFSGKNGCYIEMKPNQDGLVWHQNSSDTVGSDIHYLSYVGRHTIEITTSLVQLLTGAATATVALPAKFKNKKFAVLPTLNSIILQDASTGLNIGINGWHGYLDSQNITTPSFTYKYQLFPRDVDGGTDIEVTLEIGYIVIA